MGLRVRQDIPPDAHARHPRLEWVAQSQSRWASHGYVHDPDSRYSPPGLNKPDRKEELARWGFPADLVGDELTYMVLLNDTNQLVACSNVRPAKDPLYPNLRLHPETDDLHIPHVGRLPGFEDPTPTPSHPPGPTPVTVETVTDDTVSPTVPSEETDPSEASTPHITNIQDYYEVPVRDLTYENGYFDRAGASLGF